MPDLHRYVVHGRMPLRRTPVSGLFTTRFKEDAFFVDFSDRALLFNSGARTEQSLQLPLYFVDEAYHMRKRLVESIGLTGAKGRLELFIQYALLPILDESNLEKMRQKALDQGILLRKELVARQEQQALIDLLMLDWCDEPIIQFEYERSEFRLRIKARVPQPEAMPLSAVRTKKGRAHYYQGYEDLLCSKAAFYAVNAFETLPFLQQVELVLLRMEAQPVKGLVLAEEMERARPDYGLRRLDPTTIPAEETSKERKAREKTQREQEKVEAEKLKKLSKEKKKIAFTQRESDIADSLFDGSLPNQSPLLSARLPRQGFMDLQKSRMNYSARKAMELFDLRFETDETTTTIQEITPYF